MSTPAVAVAVAVAPAAVRAYAVGGINHYDSRNNDIYDDGMSTSFSSLPPPLLPPSTAAAGVVEVEAYVVVTEDEDDKETGRNRMTEWEHYIHDLSRDLPTPRAQTMLDRPTVQPFVIVKGVAIDNNNNNNNIQSSSSSRQSSSKSDCWCSSCCCGGGDLPDLSV